MYVTIRTLSDLRCRVGAVPPRAPPLLISSAAPLRRSRFRAAVLCSAVQCRAVPRSAAQCRAPSVIVPCRAVLRGCLDKSPQQEWHSRGERLTQH
eukprot:8642551-Pyramimonas_sp.AAC.1